MKKITFFFVLLGLFLLIFTGCGSKVTVTGAVTFPDGSPLTQGFVIFENGMYQVSGAINSDGQYKMGEQNGNGIKVGDYKVRIISQSGGSSDGDPIVIYVAEKYSNVNSSNLTCSVKGKTTFNIIVEKP
ncbi:MAG: hypothetical protein LBE18_03980 [Planctomycetaceae bacterium]|jgi:hypothetical protein|nr:hypothetical protein [Planctomycetaceae bacterium]